jgi:hypothetical protein
MGIITLCFNGGGFHSVYSCWFLPHSYECNPVQLYSDYHLVVVYFSRVMVVGLFTWSLHQRPVCVLGNCHFPVDIFFSSANAKCTMCIGFLPYPSLFPLWLTVVPFPRPGVIRNPVVFYYACIEGSSPMVDMFLRTSSSLCY